MRRSLSPLLAIILTVCVAASEASHNWGGIDVCTAYRGTAPPGIDPAALPEPHSRGVKLLQQYCVQCHALTGPGRHTAEEWPAVLERMRMLMDVSRRFRGLMGSIRMPDADELRALAEYLSAYALQPMQGTPRGAGAQAFVAACAACHALPDPRQYRAAHWPAVVTQMQGKAGIMGRTDLAGILADTDVLAYLQRNAADRLIVDPHGNTGAAPVAMAARDVRLPSYGPERLLWLTPVLALAALGLWRWRAGRRS